MLNWKLYLTALCITLNLVACKQSTVSKGSEPLADMPKFDIAATLHLDSLSPKFDLRFNELEHVKIGRLHAGVWIYYDIYLHGNMASISTYSTSIDTIEHTSIGKMLTGEGCYKKGLEVIDAIPDKIYNTTDTILNFDCAACDAKGLYVGYTKAVNADKREGMRRYEVYIESCYNNDAEVAAFAQKLQTVINELQYYCKD